MDVEDVEHFIDDWRAGIIVVAILVLIFSAGLLVWWLIRDHLDSLVFFIELIVSIVVGSVVVAFLGHLARDIFSDRSHRR